MMYMSKVLHLVLVCICTLYLLSESCANSRFNENEMEALHVLYTDTGGDTSWLWVEGDELRPLWNFTQDGSGNYLHNPCSSENGTLVWQGVTCSSSPFICAIQTCHVTELSLGAYNLQGELPASLGDILSLKVLDLQNNLLSGSLQPSLFLLQNLTFLALNGNLLSGPLPYELGMAQDLHTLGLGSNMLTGSLIPEIGRLQQLRNIYLHENMLSGPLPPDLGLLLGLQNMYLHFNMFTGTLQAVKWDFLQSLQFLALFDNHLMGSIPMNVMAGMTQLFYLGLFHNSLTGSLSAEVDQLQSLRYLVLNGNLLTGQIPSEVGSLPYLQFLVLYGNMFTGPLPREVGNLFYLQVLIVNDNFLTGELVEEVSRCVYLENLIVYDNLLTGPLPSSLGTLSLLKGLYLYDNTFTGTLPFQLGNQSSLQFLYLQNNVFTGTLPATLGSISRGEEMLLFSNLLEGSIPTELSLCSSLRVLRIQDNDLSGSVEGIFGTSMSALEHLDVSDNKLSQDIPSDIFELPSISTIALSLNCFQGHLPTGICAAASMSVLSMDGLGAAVGCKHAVKVPLSGVTLFNTLGGRIPPCIWSLPLLQVLHLTGNGLTGSISGVLAHNSSLKTLSLAHNRLSGTIPSSFTRAQDFEYLDLSYNKLRGRYPNAPATGSNSSVIYLEINRLSGRFPSIPISTEIGHLNALRGNLFACGNIPQQDEHSESYTCGSEELDASLLIMVSMVALLLGVAWVLYEAVKRDVIRVAWMERLCLLLQNQELYVIYFRDLIAGNGNSGGGSVSQSIATIGMFSKELHTTTRLLARILALHFVMCIPIYAVKAMEYGAADTVHSTHSYQYRWMGTLAYLRGRLSATLILVMWLAAVAFLRALTMHEGPFRSWFPWRSARRYTSGLSSTATESYHLTYASTSIFTVIKYIVICLVNIAIVGTVNGCYIYLTSQSLSPTSLVISQISLAVFKVIWNVAIVPSLARPMKSADKIIRVELVLLLFNNILLPCIVTALTSPACFQGLLVDPDEVSSSYEYSFCRAVGYGADGSSFCVLTGVAEVDVAPLTPPYSYNHLCTSVIITSFIPVYIFVYAMGMLVPIFYVSVFTSVSYSLLPRQFLYAVVDGLYWPDEWPAKYATSGCTGDSCSNGISDSSKSGPMDHVVEPWMLLVANRIVTADILDHMLVLFTFGMCSPLLAMSIMVSVSFKHYMWIMLLGRFVHTRVLTRCTLEGGKVVEDWAIVALSKTCLPVPVLDLVSRSVWPIIWTSAVFFSFLCWDVAADQEGGLRALWAMGSVLCAPVVMWIGMSVYQSHRHSRVQKTKGGEAGSVTPNPLHTKTDDLNLRADDVGEGVEMSSGVV